MFKILFIVLVLIAGGAFFWEVRKPQPIFAPIVEQIKNQVTEKPSASPKINLDKPPISKEIPIRTHAFQSFNNCGPAALSMALSYYGIDKSQQELGQALRPYQIPGGNNDDKSVTLEELAEKSKEFNLIPYHRPNGNVETLKLFISYDIPIITRTWLKPNDDIGHYRVVRGYDETSFIQDDSLQNKNLKYTFTDFNEIWKKFNYEYLVLIPKEKHEIAEAILGENLDPKISWQKAVELSQKELEKNPEDIYARFNLSVAYYNIGDYQKSVEEFEKVESYLSFRTLWYQIEPVQAYFELGNYDRVFEITDKVLDYHNRAFSELYLIRGRIYQKQGKLEEAKSEFQKAVQYNINLKPAQEALESI